MTAEPVVFPSLEWFESLQCLVNEDAGYRQFGTVDAAMGVKVNDAIFIVAFEAFQCKSVRAGTEYDLINVDFYVFQHHSKRFGLYYDILCPGLIEAKSGQGPKVTSTILTKNRTFIPIPNEIAKTFLPEADERKRLEVRCDVLYLDDPESLESLAL